MSTAINRISDLLFHEKKIHTIPHQLIAKTLHKFPTKHCPKQEKSNHTQNTLADFPFSLLTFSVVALEIALFLLLFVVLSQTRIVGRWRARERERETHTNSHASRKRSANCQKIIALHALLSSLVVRRSFFFSVAVVFASMNIVILLLTHCFCFCCSSAEFSSVHRAIFFLVTSFFFCSSADTTKVVKFSAAAKCGFLIVSLNCRTARLGCSAVR